jgi:hypothetical protein
MPTISPLPSPRGTSHERLYILRGGARRSPTAAYDSRGRDPGLAYDDVDPVNELFGWITQNLDDAAQNRLSEMLAAKPAQDEEAAPSLDPNATRAGVNWTSAAQAPTQCGRLRDGLRASASDCPGPKIRKRDEAGVRSTRFSDIRRSREAQTRGRCGNHEVVRRAVVQRASG